MAVECIFYSSSCYRADITNVLTISTEKYIFIWVASCTSLSFKEVQAYRRFS